MEQLPHTPQSISKITDNIVDQGFTQNIKKKVFSVKSLNSEKDCRNNLDKNLERKIKNEAQRKFKENIIDSIKNVIGKNLESKSNKSQKISNKLDKCIRKSMKLSASKIEHNKKKPININNERVKSPKSISKRGNSYKNLHAFEVYYQKNWKSKKLRQSSIQLKKLI